MSYYWHQKHAIRIIYHNGPFEHTKHLFKHAKVLKVFEITLFQILPLILKCKGRTTPFAFQKLHTAKPPSKYFLWTDNLLSITLKRIKFDQFSIYFCGPYLWSKILTKKTFICNLKYYPLFKNKLNEVIFFF